MRLGVTGLPDLYPSYDGKAASSFANPVRDQSVSEVTGAGNSVGGTNYWTNEDRRPSKEEAHEKVDDLREFIDDVVEVGGEFIPEEITNNIPWWLEAPIYLAPYAADILIEIDPSDRLRD